VVCPYNGIRDFLLARFTWLQVIGVMQAITVILNYTLASLVSTAVSLQFLTSLRLLGSEISCLLARTVSDYKGNGVMGFYKGNGFLA